MFARLGVKSVGVIGFFWLVIAGVSWRQRAIFGHFFVTPSLFRHCESGALAAPVGAGEARSAGASALRFRCLPTYRDQQLPGAWAVGIPMARTCCPLGPHLSDPAGLGTSGQFDSECSLPGYWRLVLWAAPLIAAMLVDTLATRAGSTRKRAKMLKKLVIAAAAAGLGLTLAAAPAQAEPGNGKAYGHGCVLVDRSEYGTPGAMLQFLAERDGSFQNTVDKYFDSVADLIHKKCDNSTD